MLAVANSKEYRNSSPQQIVPELAEKGEYIASEPTFYRILRQEKQLAHLCQSAVPLLQAGGNSHRNGGINLIYLDRA